MTEKQSLAAIYAFEGFGPERTSLLVSFFGSARKTWRASKPDLTNVGLKPNLVNHFVNHKRQFETSKYFERLRKQNINFVTVNEDCFPANLIGLKGSPLVLYYKGNIKNIDNAVAIVGSRRMTSYGQTVTTRFATKLSKLGIVIVSGLALGNDAAAHKACLEVGGRGVAVLASGLDTISPLTNKWIGLELIKKGGAVVSEYPMGMPPRRSNFAARNRIISGLSKAIIVIEGLRRSGTLYTASAAAEQGKPLFAVPGQITSPMSGASHFLLKRGAMMITSAEDVLGELDMKVSKRRKKS